MADPQQDQDLQRIEALDKLIGNSDNQAVDTGLGETVDEVAIQVEDAANNADVSAAEEAAMSFQDSSTGEDIPLAATGFSPNTAKNESIVDPIDRVKLAPGNKKGKLNYLKENFDDAQINDYGDFVVEKEGEWYKVDPSSLGMIDDWRNTKQLIKASKEVAMDVVDVWPEVVAAGVGIGTAVATGGSSFLAMMGAEAAAAGGVASYRTLLGRAVGTYDATPEETALDIGMEGVLATAGVGVMAGVKPGGAWLSKNIPAISKGLRKVNEVPESMGMSVGKWFANNGGVSANAYETMVKKPGPLRSTVKSITKKAAGIGGDSREAFWQASQEAQLDDLFNFATQARKLKSKLFNRMQNEVIVKAGDDFVNPSARSAYSAAMDSVQAGMTKVQVRVAEESGDFAQSAAGKVFAKVTGKAPSKVARWKTLSPKESVEWLLKQAESGKPLNPKQAKFITPSAAELDRLAANGAHVDSGLGELSTSPEGVQALERLNDSLMSMAKSKATRGETGVRMAMENNKVFKRNLRSVTDQMKNVNATGAMTKVSKIGERFTTATTNSLDEASNGVYSNLNKSYSQLKQSLDPLENMIKDSPEKSMKAAQTYLGQISSTRNSGILSRKGMREAQNAARQLDSGVARQLEALQDSIDLKQAALEWNPIAKGRGGTEFGMGLYAVGSANAPLLGALGAKKATASRGLNKAGTKTTQFLWKQLNVLRALDGQSKEAFMNAPAAAAGASFFAADLVASDPELRDNLLSKIPLRDGQ